MKAKIPKNHLYFTAKEFADLNKISHRRAVRILNDLVLMKKLERKKPNHNHKDSFWYFELKSGETNRKK